jgi:hypothetical protein
MKTNSQLFSLVLMLVCSTLYAQTSPSFKGPVVYMEYGGGSSLVSVNVEHAIFKLPRWYVNGRIGYGYMLINNYERSGFPIGINLFRFQGNHHLEIGAGVSYIEGIKRYYSGGEYRWNRALYAYAAAGYRFQKPDGGLFFKFLWHPLYQVREYNPDPYFRDSTVLKYWLALSCGYSFNREKRTDN